MILLWGVESDRPLGSVHEELLRLGAPVVLVDQRAVLETAVEIAIDAEVAGWIRTTTAAVDLASVTAAYVRPYDARAVPVVAATGAGSAAWHYSGAVDELMSAWSEVTPALVVNRLAPMASNGSKPYQLERIREAGFAVPETLVTTDPDAAREFWERHRTVVYKSISGVRSRVSRLRAEHADRLADVSSCPTQFQQYVAGRDYRLHVVGDRLFACQITCAADDYRYPDVNPIEMRPFTLPPAIEERCLRVSRLLDLTLTGIDLRRSADDEWYCFEANPSPAFTYFEQGTGQPIGRAIAELLAGATPVQNEPAAAAAGLA